jgi:hypothetical protein
MKTFNKVVSAAVLLVILAVPVVVISHAQALEDWWSLRGYAPPASVEKLASEDTMTNKARHMFYATHPQLISDKAQLRSACPLSEQTIVLGCYYQVAGSFRDGIAVFDVSDERLAGVEQVTAAHEMLHSAYDRLSSNDKNYIDGLLTNYYNNDLHDQRIIDTINAYKKSEPNDVVNEMHSVFGTEVTNLPAPLEDYYKKYFTNRQAVTNFSNQYESVFSQNKSQLDSLKAQIERLKTELTSDKATIESEENALNTESRRMQSLLSGGKTDQYNAAVNGYNVRVQGVRSLIAAYNAKVGQVNSLVEQYNSVAYTQESLYNSIDTRLQTQTAQ